MTKQFMAVLGIGLVAVGVVVFLIFASTKGSHLELNGEILKIRTGALEADSSIAVVDFRVENPTDVAFVVRTAELSADRADGSAMEGQMVARSDLDRLFEFNRLLGKRYNDTLVLTDRIGPHAKVDRMVAARFAMPLTELDKVKSVHLRVQDVDGPTWETSRGLTR